MRYNRFETEAAVTTKGIEPGSKICDIRKKAITFLLLLDETVVS
jgi:hypothetical protein